MKKIKCENKDKKAVKIKIRVLHNQNLYQKQFLSYAFKQI